MQGSSLLDRPYFYCVDCSLGFSPFDEALELASRRKQYDLLSRARLFHHEVGQVISDLEQMKARNEDAKEQIRKLINYLDNNKDRIHYHGDRIGGMLPSQTASSEKEKAAAVTLPH